MYSIHLLVFSKHISLRLMTYKKFCLLFTWDRNLGRNAIGGGFGKDFFSTKHKNTQWKSENIWKTQKQQLVLIRSWFVASVHFSPHWDWWQKSKPDSVQLWLQMFYSNSIVKRNMDHCEGNVCFLGNRNMWQLKQSYLQLKTMGSIY